MSSDSSPSLPSSKRRVLSDASPPAKKSRLDSSAAEVSRPQKAKKEKKKKSKKSKSESEFEEVSAPADESEAPEQAPTLDGDDDLADILALKKGANANANKPNKEANITDSANTSSRIFLGNLPFAVQDSDLHDLFGSCGEIAGLHYVLDKTTGKFYGSAFIDFSSPSAVNKALKLNGSELHGRPIKVGPAAGQQKVGMNRNNSKEKNGAHLAKFPISAKPEGCKTVFIGNLSFNITDDLVKAEFGGCGSIEEIRWVEKDGVFKGCGFIQFENTEAADKAVKFNGKEVMGRPIRVDYSQKE